MTRRIITTENLEEDVKIENSLRPKVSERLHRAGEGKGHTEDLY